MYAGIHSINEGNTTPFEKGTNNVMFNAQFDYGNPFEIRKRKPFDFFRLRADFNFGVEKKFLDNLTGYGILYNNSVYIVGEECMANGMLLGESQVCLVFTD